MKVVITIDCDTEAFNGADCGFELARILRGVTERVDFMPKDKLLSRYRWGPSRLRDHDGNAVGTLTIDDFDFDDDDLAKMFANLKDSERDELDW